MKGKMRFLEQLTAAADLQDEPVPGVPLVEIAGNFRVLIEHHRGVTEYSRQCVCLNVKFGCIRISGCNLEISKMTRDQMIVSGAIENIALVRGRN